MTRHAAFAPVVDAGVRVLIMGSLPGAASLAAGRYYAHPRNLFWTLAGAAIGVELTALGYDARRAALLGAGVGLWDTVAEAARAGSLDAALRAVVAADLSGLIATLPALRAVAFNGATAARLGRRALGDGAGLMLIDLPSSSPAFAAMPVGEKVARWGVLRDALLPPPGEAR